MLNQPTRLPPLVVKYGGSSLDLELEVCDTPHRHITSTGRAFRDISKQRLLLVMPGGGPTNELTKAIRDNYTGHELSESLLADLYRRALTINTDLLNAHWQARAIDPGSPSGRQTFATLRGRTSGFYVMPYAPVSVVESNELVTYRNSDTLTLGVAESLGTQTVIFLKDASGVWSYDPAWKRSSSPPPNARLDFFPKLTPHELLHNVSRIGAVDHKDDHLIERAAVEFFAEHCQSIQQVVIGDVSRAVNIISDVVGEQIRPSEERKYSVIYQKSPKALD